MTLLISAKSLSAGMAALVLAPLPSLAQTWITVGRTYFSDSQVTETEQIDLSSAFKRDGVVFARGKRTDYLQKLGVSRKPVYLSWLADCNGNQIGFDIDSMPHGGRWLYAGEDRWIDTKTGQVHGMDNAQKKKPAGVRQEFWELLNRTSAEFKSKIRAEPEDNVRWTKVFTLLCGHPPGQRGKKAGVIS